jgi:hypothetical protein
MSKIEISLQIRESYLSNPVELKLDNQWDRSTLGKNAKQIGIYIIFTQKPERCIYIGKTRGNQMDFATRLYRHATEAASQNGKVYRKLNEICHNEPEKAINVALITSDDVKNHFNIINNDLSESAMIDILEQVLIHYMHPEIQDT